MRCDSVWCSSSNVVAQHQRKSRGQPCWGWYKGFGLRLDLRRTSCKLLCTFFKCVLFFDNAHLFHRIIPCSSCTIQSLSIPFEALAMRYISVSIRQLSSSPDLRPQRGREDASNPLVNLQRASGQPTLAGETKTKIAVATILCYIRTSSQIFVPSAVLAAGESKRRPFLE